MIIVNNIDFKSISGSVSGVPYSVSYTQDKYEAMIALEEKANKASTMEDLKSIVEDFQRFTHESYKDIVESSCPYISVNPSTNKFYLTLNGVRSSHAMPEALAKKIIDSADKNLPFMPIVKFWTRFLRNPNYSEKKANLLAKYIMAPYTNHNKVEELMKVEGLSKSVATERATNTQVSITQEGLLVGYKVSKEVLVRYDLNDNEEVVQRSRYKKKIDPDTGLVTMEEPQHVEDRLFQPYVQGTSGDEFFCGLESQGGTLGHFIRVGKVHYLPKWDQVNCDDSVTCVKGLHVGGLHYINGYQNGTDAVTHNVFIDPMHIGAVCDVENGDGALRVKQYFVHSSFKGVNKTIYHSSDYAALTDKEYEQMLAEVIESTKANQSELDGRIAEAKALAK